MLCQWWTGIQTCRSWSVSTMSKIKPGSKFHQCRRDSSKRSFSTTSTKAPGRGGISGLYLSLLESHPLTTKAATSGFLTFSADIICQINFPTKGSRMEAFENSIQADVASDPQKKKPSAPVLDYLRQVEWARTGNFTLLGIVYIAPSMHFWYGFLMRAFTGNSMRITMLRTAMDQSLFAPTFLTFFFINSSAIEYITGKISRQGNGDFKEEMAALYKEIQGKIRKDLVDTCLTNWMVWIPSMILCFKYVPPNLQVLWSNSIGFFWNIYLSWTLANEHVPPPVTSSKVDKPALATSKQSP